MTVRNTLYQVMEGKVVAAIVSLFVVGNVVLIILATVDDIYNANLDLFFALEIVTLTVFTVEYLIRLYVCVENEKYRGRWGRLRYMVSFSALVDLIATLPFIILLAWNRTFEHGYGVFAVLRVLRVIRLVKIDRLTRASGLLFDIFAYNAELFLVVFVLELVLYILCCSFLHLANNTLYPSIPAAMYDGVLLLLGVGTPDETQLSPGAKVVVGISVYISVFFFALPAGLLAGATGIERVAEMRKSQVDLRTPATTAAEMGGLLVNSDESSKSMVECPNCGHAFSH